MNLKSMVLAALLMSGVMGAQAYAGELTVQVSGITQAKGDILVAVFDQKGQWLKQSVFRQKTAAVQDKVVLMFDNLPEGEYAISVMHDVNGNGKLDSNAIGIPSEPYGFSNDAAGSFGPPSYDDAKIKVGADKQAIHIQLMSVF